MCSSQFAVFVFLGAVGALWFGFLDGGSEDVLGDIVSCLLVVGVQSVPHGYGATLTFLDSLHTVVIRRVKTNDATTRGGNTRLKRTPRFMFHDIVLLNMIYL